MAIRNPHELKALLAPGRRLAGLDVGEKTIGVAVSDPGLGIASPIDTIRRTKFGEDVKALAKMLSGREIGGFVVGLPINMDGTEGPRCQSVRHFADNLLQHADLLGREPEIAFWDERLSTAAVERFMIEQADMSRGKRAHAVDKMAAAYILQGALDAMTSRAARP
ncbi:MAG TPA: Holliday junction resolvase RuvX [Alphaproteobacteria bacterium]|nr:Holliday junction resolvase RuvX [Alphaproteobacteria bacterium]